MVRAQQLAFLFLLLPAFWGCSDSASTAGWESPSDADSLSITLESAARSDAFVSAVQVLEAIENDSNWIIIDVRKVEEFSAGHLPSAHRLWRNDIESSEFPYGGMAIEKEALEAILSSFGATSQSKFVVYDAIGGCDAARLWWLIRLYGHQSVALLDGGWQVWQALDHPAVQAETPKKHAKFTFTQGADSSLIVSKDQLMSLHAQSDVILVDTRTLEEYNGSIQKPGAFAAGHIPNSVHFDWGRSVDMAGDYRLHAPEAILQDLAEVGITPDKTVITYCHSGVRSAHTTLVLRELLGFEHVHNYDGSWIEWSYALHPSKDSIENELQ